MPHPLDNPIWESLTTHHASFALADGAAKRYPKEIGPFAGMARGGADLSVDASLMKLVGESDLVYFLGQIPQLGPEWRVHRHDPLPQLICREPIAAIEGPEVVELTSAHHADMLALTRLVYPGYFRERTPAIGGYIGIYLNGRLAAMAGQRLHCHEYVEISAICTHPDHVGKGYAQRLLAILTNRALERGEIPFLHVSRENTRARAVYDLLGYRERTALPFVSIERGRSGA